MASTSANQQCQLSIQLAALLSNAFLVLAYRDIETYVRNPAHHKQYHSAIFTFYSYNNQKLFPFHYSYTTLVINGASVMRITYVRVWMRLIRIESEFAGFPFNVLLNLHLCEQA